LQAHAGTIQDVATRVVIGLTSLDLIREYGALGDVWEAVLQAWGLVPFTDLYG
jgi:hypothetical protein